MIMGMAALHLSLADMGRLAQVSRECYRGIGMAINALPAMQTVSTVKYQAMIMFQLFYSIGVIRTQTCDDRLEYDSICHIRDYFTSIMSAEYRDKIGDDWGPGKGCLSVDDSCLGSYQDYVSRRNSRIRHCGIFIERRGCLMSRTHGGISPLNLLLGMTCVEYMKQKNTMQYEDDVDRWVAFINGSLNVASQFVPSMTFDFTNIVFCYGMNGYANDY